MQLSRLFDTGHQAQNTLWDEGPGNLKAQMPQSRGEMSVWGRWDDTGQSQPAKGVLP